MDCSPSRHDSQVNRSTTRKPFPVKHRIPSQPLPTDHMPITSALRCRSPVFRRLSCPGVCTGGAEKPLRAQDRKPGTRSRQTDFRSACLYLVQGTANGKLRIVSHDFGVIHGAVDVCLDRRLDISPRRSCESASLLDPGHAGGRYARVTICSCVR